MALGIQHAWHKCSAAMDLYRRQGHLQHRLHVHDHRHGCEDNDVKLNAINTGPATTDCTNAGPANTNCMIYQYKYDTICYRDPKEVKWGAQAIIDGGAKKLVSWDPAKDDS